MNDSVKTRFEFYLIEIESSLNSSTFHLIRVLIVYDIKNTSNTSFKFEKKKKHTSKINVLMEQFTKKLVNN